MSSKISELASACSANWSNILGGQARSLAERNKMAELLDSKRLIPTDTCFVAFGSMARGEWSPQSDLDWALLIDGQVDETHLDVTQEIARQLKSLGGRPKPASEGGLKTGQSKEARPGR